MPTDPVFAVIFSLAPTVLIGLVFWFIMRAIIRADRGERAAYAKIEAEERAKLAASQRSATTREGAA
jgi:flagellar biosynthesis/type III secretory pathway M-ring protein FliF/YscJ